MDTCDIRAKTKFQLWVSKYGFAFGVFLKFATSILLYMKSCNGSLETFLCSRQALHLLDLVF